MHALLAYGRFAAYAATAALVLLGCSNQSPMGALGSQAPEVRALAALSPGVNATFDERAAASGVSPSCYSEGLVANQGANALGQELLGYVPNPLCLGVKQISESGTRTGAAAMSPQADWNANQPAACSPSQAISLERGEGSVAELKVFFGSFASKKPVVLVPSIQGSSLSTGNYSIAVSGDTAVVRVRLSATLPLEKFAIWTGATDAYGERVDCQFVVDAAPVEAQPIVIPADPVVVAAPAPDVQEGGTELATQGPSTLPAPEGETAAPAVAEQPAAPVIADEPAVEEQPAAPVPEIAPVVILPASDPLVLTAEPEQPAAAPEQPAAAELPPAPVLGDDGGAATANPGGVPAPDFSSPSDPVSAVEELPPVVLTKPPPPQAVEPLPPVVLTPMEEAPSRNTASEPVVNPDDQLADEGNDLDAVVVDDNDAADAGGSADSNLGLQCLGNPTLAAGADGFVELQLNRPLTKGELKRLRAVFRIHDRIDGLMTERLLTSHLRSLKLRLHAPSSIAFLQRSTVEVSVGGASASCQVTFTPGYLDDSGKLVSLNGGYCGLASIGAYSGVLDKTTAEAEVFFAMQVSNNRDAVHLSVDSGAIDLAKDVSVKVSGPFSEKITVNRRTNASVLRIAYAYLLGGQWKSETCTMTVPALDAIAGTVPPSYIGSQGLVGSVYKVKENTSSLYTRQALDALTPAAPLYMSMLDVAARSFSSGFPGVKDLFEWFQLRIGRVSPSEKVPNVRIFLPESTTYQFSMNSDDGSKLYIDGKLVLNNDGLHAPATRESGELVYAAGWHDFAVDYYQGPRYQIALTLSWRSKGKANGDFDLTGSYKLIPAKAFFTEPQDIAVSAH